VTKGCRPFLFFAKNGAKSEMEEKSKFILYIKALFFGLEKANGNLYTKMQKLQYVMQ
jgi:hypothetical protein